jgi:prepilin-type N-terminal cleavage/methylation domain-containing protein
MRTTRTAGAAKNRGRQSGMSMVEVLIAMLVLVVGMMGSMILVRTAIVNNNRNKLDTTSTALAQMVLEQITSRQATANTNIIINDCTGVARTINPNVGGATLIAAGFNQGNIDFTQNLAAVPAGYSMQYITCGNANAQVTYEIRWNVTAMTVFTKLVTVSARKQIATATGSLPYFSVPVTLRGIAGE